MVLTLDDEGDAVSRWAVDGAGPPILEARLSRGDEGWPGGEACAVAVTPDASRYAVAFDGGAEGEVVVFDRAGRVLLRARGDECEVALSADGRRVATLDGIAEAHVFDVDSGERLVGLRLAPDVLQAGLRELALNRDGSLLAGVLQGDVRVYRIPDGGADPVGRFPLGTGAVAHRLRFEESLLWWAEATRLRAADVSPCSR